MMLGYFTVATVLIFSLSGLVAGSYWLWLALKPPHRFFNRGFLILCVVAGSGAYKWDLLRTGSVSSAVWTSVFTVLLLVLVCAKFAFPLGGKPRRRYTPKSFPE